MQSMNQALQILWDNARDHVSAEEMEVLAGASDFAAMTARHLASVCEGVGMLVSDDIRKPSSQVGAFRDEGLPELLFALGVGFETVSALVDIGDEAGYLSRQATAEKPTA